MSLPAPVNTDGRTLTINLVIPAASLALLNGGQPWVQITSGSWTYAGTWNGAGTFTADTVTSLTQPYPASGFDVAQNLGFQLQDKTGISGTGPATIYIQSISIN
jgi:hypothetical protein